MPSNDAVISRERRIVRLANAGKHADLLLADTKLGILACTLCGVTVINVHRHLANRHSEFDIGDRRTLCQYHAEQSTELEGPTNQPRPHNGVSNPTDAVRGLKIMPGLACLWPDCNHLTTDKQARQKHVKKEHKSSRTDLLKEVYLQTFSPIAAGPKYFCVKAPGGDNKHAQPMGGRFRIVGYDFAPPRGTQNAALSLEPAEPILRASTATSEARADVTSPLTGGHQTSTAPDPVRRVSTSADWFKQAGWVDHFAGRERWVVEARRMALGTVEGHALRLSKVLDRLILRYLTRHLDDMPWQAAQVIDGLNLPDSRTMGFPAEVWHDRTSVDRHITLMHRFLCYCLHVSLYDDAKLLATQGVVFTQEQRDSLGQLRDHLRACRDEAGEGQNGTGTREGSVVDAESGSRECRLEKRVLDVLASFWLQRIDDDPFASPLWHFVGVLGIDRQTAQLQPPHKFLHILSGLAFVGSILLRTRMARPREPSDSGSSPSPGPESEPLPLSRLLHTTPATEPASSPMDKVLSLLAAGKDCIEERERNSAVSWSREHDALYARDSLVLAGGLRVMVESMTRETEDLLWSQLMPICHDSDSERAPVPLHHVKDDLSAASQLGSFLPQDGLPGEDDPAATGMISSSRRDEFVDGDGSWKWPAVDRFLTTLTRFKELLLVLCQITGGQPSHGPDIAGLRLVGSGIRDRNVFVVDGEVVLVTHHYKSLYQVDSAKAMPRFLPARIGQLLVLYMIHLRPLTDAWDLARQTLPGKEAITTGLLWHDEEGQWDVGRMDRAMLRCTGQYMADPISLYDWRQVALAISRRDADHRGAERADFEDSEDEEGAGHGPRPVVGNVTGEDHSGGDVHTVPTGMWSGLTADMLANARQVSHRWHTLLGCHEDQGAAIDLTSLSTPSPSPRHSSALSQSPLHAPSSGGERRSSTPSGSRSASVSAPHSRHLSPVRSGHKRKDTPNSPKEGEPSLSPTKRSRVSADAARRPLDTEAGLDERRASAASQLETPDSALRLPTSGDGEHADTVPPHSTVVSGYEPNVRHVVVCRKKGRGIAEVLRRARDSMENMAAGEKGVIYCSVETKCRALQRHLGCHYHESVHDDVACSQSSVERREGLQSRIRGSGSFIIASSSEVLKRCTELGGEGIVTVIHLGTPTTTGEYLDDIRWSAATTKNKLIASELVVEGDIEGLQTSVEMRRYVEAVGCRRLALRQHVDDAVQECKTVPGIAICDNCTEAQVTASLA